MNTIEMQLAELAATVIRTRPDEIDCDQVLERLAPYVEALASTGTVPAELRVIAQHLAECPECREELDALLLATGLTM